MADTSRPPCPPRLLYRLPQRLSFICMWTLESAHPAPSPSALNCAGFLNMTVSIWRQTPSGVVCVPQDVARLPCVGSSVVPIGTLHRDTFILHISGWTCVSLLPLASLCRQWVFSAVSLPHIHRQTLGPTYGVCNLPDGGRGRGHPALPFI